MADYAKLQIKGVFSKSSDYSDPVTSFTPAAYTVTPDEYLHCEVQAALAGDTVGHTTVDTSILASVSLVVIKNNDATNYVTVTFGKTGSGSADTSIRVAAKGYLVMTDFLPTHKLKLVANTAHCECEIFVVGS